MCTDTGSHYNPGNKDHGGEDTAIRHAGDMGNIEAGQDNIATVDKKIKEDLNKLIGRFGDIIKQHSSAWQVQ